MALTDSLSDFLTVVRNAARAGKKTVTTRTSNVINALAKILKEEGFIEECKEIEEGGKRFIHLQLKYTGENRAAIQQLQRLSKPGLRSYVGWEDIPAVLNGLGIAIVSTSRGLMTGRQARKERVGGELICKVW